MVVRPSFRKAFANQAPAVLICLAFVGLPVEISLHAASVLEAKVVFTVGSWIAAILVGLHTICVAVSQDAGMTWKTLEKRNLLQGALFVLGAALALSG
ncbi:hypothetical protein [Bradyrhizobium sp. RDI18]|uniref:hypothetical protein n=1 Tax=Bradyrhizobium sp. RDI18 TaxID=3367400 RepID=UPI00371ECB23